MFGGTGLSEPFRGAPALGSFSMSLLGGLAGGPYLGGPSPQCRNLRPNSGSLCPAMSRPFESRMSTRWRRTRAFRSVSHVRKAGKPSRVRTFEASLVTAVGSRSCALKFSVVTATDAAAIKTIAAQKDKKTRVKIRCKRVLRIAVTDWTSPDPTTLRDSPPRARQGLAWNCRCVFQVCAGGCSHACRRSDPNLSTCVRAHGA